MKVFELKTKENRTTELFQIENYTSKEEVMKKLNSVLKIDSLYTDNSEGNFNYVCVNWNNYCFFVSNLTEFSEGLQTEEDWRVDYKVEI
jgi:hypothetical protein